MPDAEQTLVTTPVGLTDPYKDNLDRSAQLWARIPKDEKRKIKSIHPEDNVIQHILARFWLELVIHCEKQGWRDFSNMDEFCEFINNMGIVDKRSKPTKAKKNGGV